MIAEPYIFPTGAFAGRIEWFDRDDEKIAKSHGWISYAVFEREKLKDLGYCHIVITAKRGFECECRYGYQSKNSICSAQLIDYELGDFCNDSESHRLLKRAEFLKAVCEKEGVEWLPKSETAKDPGEARKAILNFCGSDPCTTPGCINCQEVAHHKACECRRCTGRKPERDIVKEVCAESPTEWCKGRDGVVHTILIGDPTDTCVYCGHVGKPLERDYYTKDEIKRMLGTLCRMLIQVKPKFHRNPNINQSEFWIKSVAEVINLL